MKTFSCLLLAILFVSSTAQGELVIDNFTPTGGPGGASVGISNGAPQLGYALNDGITGTRDFSVSSGASVLLTQSSPTVGNVAFNVFGAGSGQSYTIVYNLGRTINFSGVGGDRSPTLLVDLFDSIPVTHFLDVTLSSGGIDQSFATATVAPGSGGYVRQFDGSTLANQAAAALVDKITIRVSRAFSFAGTTLFGGGARVSAVPEPASMMLLGLTGVGGFVVARHRRRVAIEQAS